MLCHTFMDRLFSFPQILHSSLHWMAETTLLSLCLGVRYRIEMLRLFFLSSSFLGSSFLEVLEKPHVLSAVLRCFFSFFVPWVVVGISLALCFSVLITAACVPVVV